MANAAHPRPHPRDEKRGDKASAGCKHAKPDVKHQVRRGKAASANRFLALIYPLHGMGGCHRGPRASNELYRNGLGRGEVCRNARGSISAELRVVRKLFEHLVAARRLKIKKRTLHDEIHRRRDMTHVKIERIELMPEVVFWLVV
jgi:hypothetical protein